jgi:hypothetical protein
MKIKLVQSGGLLPVKKEAIAEVDWDKDECENILKDISLPDNYHSLVRDGINYTVEINNKEIEVDLSKAKGKYAATFQQLKKNLKIVKT